jgi:hypothetical protein
MTDRQEQRGGDGPNLQAGRDIVLQAGLSVGDAHAIYDSKTALLRAELTAEAEELVSARISRLEQTLFARLGSPELLGAFKNPDFQFNLLEAQRSASRTGDTGDIDLIVDILVQRAESPESPRLRVATRRALETVGQLSNDALTGLTVLWYGTTLSPAAYVLSDFLGHMNQQLAPLVAGLPTDDKWLGDLSLLDCIQAGFTGIGNLKSFVQLTGEKFPAAICNGWSSTTDDDVAASFRELHPGLEAFVIDHPLQADRRTLLGRDETLIRKIAGDFAREAFLDEVRVQAAIEHAITVCALNTRAPQWEQLFSTQLRSFEALAAIDDWWTATFPPMSITAVGVAISFANLKRLCPSVSLPTLDLLL